MVRVLTSYYKHRLTNNDYTSKLIGLKLSQKYSNNLSSYSRNVFSKVLKNFKDIKVAAAVYGSAAREEMSAESDADILIITNTGSKKEKEFRNAFIKSFENTNQFSKVDVPEWGTVEQLEHLVINSIPEGNQVLEAIPVAGDTNLIHKFLQMRKRADTKGRVLRNLVFQKYCFNNYYRKRKKPGLLNVKYSKGGTRDLLFFIYVSKLISRNINTVTEAIDLLEKKRVISKREAVSLYKAASTVTLVRSETLVHNKGTSLSNLSFFDPKSNALFASSEVIQENFKSAKKFLEDFRSSQKIIAKYKDHVINWGLKNFLSKEEFSQIAALKDQRNAVQNIRNSLGNKSVVVRISAIWELANRHLLSKTQKEIRKIINQKIYPWEVAASLVSIPELSSGDIRRVTKRIINKTDYGYILRIVAQNKKTPVDVLEIICRKKKDKRYTQLANIALSGRREETNFQV
jgi:predicted nucleotidyltransferase